MTIEASASPGTILVVEDEVIIRSSVAQYLRECGYRVIEAANTDEALTVLRYAEIQVDAVLSDVSLPGSVDGFGLAKWVRLHRPTLDVILTGTVSRTANAAHELCDEGALPKPYDHQQLAGTSNGSLRHEPQTS